MRPSLSVSRAALTACGWCSDHSIYRRGANRELYQFLTDFLIEKWGKGGKRRAW